jgi:LL-diaminopimelate aminotransferase
MIINTADRLHTTKEYYFSTKLQEVRQLMAAGKDIINIAIGNPDRMPSVETIEALSEAAHEKDVHGYQPYRGIPELRKGLSDWMQEVYHVTLDSEEEILPMIGSKEGITHISLAFLNPGDKVLVPELGYPAYRAVSEMVGAEALTYPLIHDQWTPDFEAMDKLNLSGVKIMWVNYPHMPTGAPPNRALFEKLVGFARRHKILLCHDNPYSLILNDGDPLSLLAIPGAKEVAVELNSLSKSHNMAGWRIGWLAGSKPYIDAALKIKSNVDSGTFKPMQLAAVVALKNPAQWHIERNDLYRDRKKVVCQILDYLQCTYSDVQTGMFVWARLPEHGPDAEAMVEKLLHDYQIFLAPGFIFGEKGRRYIRISLCVPEETLAIALDRLENFRALLKTQI